ncbi:MAG: hypothetical protein NUV51_13280, partial [Sulfuricaulis sp.]|nr:hypothetical protein [Sulfuricaulis sp.]
TEGASLLTKKIKKMKKWVEMGGDGAHFFSSSISPIQERGNEQNITPELLRSEPISSNNRNEA